MTWPAAAPNHTIEQQESANAVLRAHGDRSPNFILDSRKASENRAIEGARFHLNARPGHAFGDRTGGAPWGMTKGTQIFVLVGRQKELRRTAVKSSSHALLVLGNSYK
jgi:hypothetical protein